MKYYLLIIVCFILSCKNEKKELPKALSEGSKPNIVIIYADDLGYGDVGAYGATALKTPNMDALAKGGLVFTNGYATSSTCTPSRYGLITGEYPWHRQAGILSGEAPLIIDTASITIPKFLKEQGYRTGIVGKWHLGLGNGNINWNEKITPGPNEVGFDDAFIMAATQDRVPTVYIRDGFVENLDPDDPIQVNYKKNFPGEPTGKDNPELTTMKWHHGHNNSIVNGVPRIGFMKGGKAALWNDKDMADRFLMEAKQYVKKHKDQPFFLYYALQQPHVPRTPHPRFVGASGMGPRGDVIVEADWCIGEFIKTLKKENLLKNTLIIMTSDNGPVLNDGYYDDAVEKLGSHKPAGVLRGGKYSLYEAGARVPFIAYWEGEINPGKSDAIICQMDLLPSFGKLLDVNVKAPDGEELLATLKGEDAKGREHLIIEAGRRTAFRSGDWLMIPPYDGPKYNTRTNIELGNSKDYQLYDLSNDVEQQYNVANENPEKLNEMILAYEKNLEK